MDYSSIFIAFKGGLGTLDEIFEVLTLMQTGKISKRPIFLVGSTFWNPLLDWIKVEMLFNSNNINEEDLELITIIDNFSEFSEEMLG